MVGMVYWWFQALKMIYIQVQFSFSELNPMTGCPKRALRGCKLKYFWGNIHKGHLQPKVGKSKAVSGMGRLKIFLVKGKNRREGDGFQPPPPVLTGLIEPIIVYRTVWYQVKTPIWLAMLDQKFAKHIISPIFLPQNISSYLCKDKGSVRIPISDN